ncbi:hypothetical protein Tco_0316515 [Tanacetum coccineum]
MLDQEKGVLRALCPTHLTSSRGFQLFIPGERKKQIEQMPPLSVRSSQSGHVDGLLLEASMMVESILKELAVSRLYYQLPNRRQFQLKMFYQFIRVKVKDDSATANWAQVSSKFDMLVDLIGSLFCQEQEFGNKELASLGLRTKLDRMDSKESEGLLLARFAHDHDTSEDNLDPYETDLKFRIHL